MNADFVECTEISGKTIQALRIYTDDRDGAEVQIDLTDGTSFSCSLGHLPTVKASLYRSGTGTPEIIRQFDV
jgi:hypothetical protein